MDRTGPPCVLTTIVPEAAPEPAPRRTTPPGTTMVDETVHVPAASATTWCLPAHPLSAASIAAVASPPCAGTLAHVTVRTGRPSGPSGGRTSPACAERGLRAEVDQRGGGGGGGWWGE